MRATLLLRTTLALSALSLGCEDDPAPADAGTDRGSAVDTPATPADVTPTPDRGFPADVVADTGPVDAGPPADVQRADAAVDAPTDAGTPDAGCTPVVPVGPLTGTPWCDLPLPDVAGLTVPEGFCIRRYGSVPTARVLMFAPNGDLFVASPGFSQQGGAPPGLGAIVIAPDDNRDGVSDGNVTFAEVEEVHGLLFRREEILYTTGSSVMRAPYCNGNRAVSAPVASHTRIAQLDGAVRNTHTLAEATDGRLLVSMGQYDQNVCPVSNPRSGSVLRIGEGAPINGSVVVEGFRNPMYIRCKEWGACYAAELTGDGWDSYGGTEKLIEIRQGDRYGFPCCIDRARPTPGVMGTPSTCADIAVSVQTYTLHDTPFGFDWAPSSWPAPYGGSYFVALHGWVGSWVNAGVQWAPVDSTTHRPTRPTEFFARGFGARDRGGIGQRVTDLVFARDGRMFIADDHSGDIYWIAPRTLRMPAR